MDIDVDFYYEMFMDNLKNSSFNDGKQTNRKSKNIANEKTIEMQTLNLQDKSMKLQSVHNFKFHNI